MDLDPYHDEFVWIAHFALRTVGSSTSDEWVGLLRHVMNASASVERVRNVVQWAQTAGIT